MPHSYQGHQPANRGRNLLEPHRRPERPHPTSPPGVPETIRARGRPPMANCRRTSVSAVPSTRYARTCSVSPRGPRARAQRPQPVSRPPAGSPDTITARHRYAKRGIACLLTRPMSFTLHGNASGEGQRPLSPRVHCRRPDGRGGLSRCAPRHGIPLARRALHPRSPAGPVRLHRPFRHGVVPACCRPR
jgi:hypothetical protein